MFRKHMPKDLGTANTLIFVQGEGIVLNEPSVVARDAVTERILAVGGEAKECIGRTPRNIVTIRPLKDGVIADFDMASALIAHLLRKAIGGRTQRKPHVVICVPTGITDVERRAVIEAATRAGARNIRLIDEPVAAAIGAGLPVLDPVGSMVVDIGGGTADIAVLTLGGMVCSRSARAAGDALTASVQRYLQDAMHLVVGENMAEKIKIVLGAVDALPEPLGMEVSGKDVSTASPRTVMLSDGHIREALQPVVALILDNILATLENTPPELGADLLRQGILLTGGTALLRGLDARITQATGLPVRIDPDPLTTVLRGAGATLDAPARYADLFFEYD